MKLHLIILFCVCSTISNLHAATLLVDAADANQATLLTTILSDPNKTRQSIVDALVCARQNNLPIPIIIDALNNAADQIRTAGFFKVADDDGGDGQAFIHHQARAQYLDDISSGLTGAISTSDPDPETKDSKSENQ